MFPKKRRKTFIPVGVESFPPSIPDYHRAQTSIWKAWWVFQEGQDIATGKRAPL